MSASDLRRLVPGASRPVCVLLDSARGPVEPAIRSEVFGRERFAQHGRSLAQTHEVHESARRRRAPFFPRLHDNIAMLRVAHRYIGDQARSGYQVSPAAEWLLDNFHLIEAQLKEILDGLPRRYFRDLPVLREPPLDGLPRVYGVAWAFVAHTDGAFDDDMLEHYLNAYQDVRALTLGELWALPTTLRVVLVENLRRLAERLAVNKAARELANLVCDRIESYPTDQLDTIVARLDRRDASRAFLVQMAQRLQDHQARGLTPYRDWLVKTIPDLAAAQIEQPADQVADNLSVSNAIGSLRLVGNADWSEIIARSSPTMQLMLTSPAFAAERGDTRDMTLHAIERLARRCHRSESEVTQRLLDRMHAADSDTGQAASHWLHGAGRAALLRDLSLHISLPERLRALRHRIALPAYLLLLAAGTLGSVAWVSTHHQASGPMLILISALLVCWPASEGVIAVINRLISESTRPRPLPRLAFTQGIPPDHRVMVVVPAMLTSADAAIELAHRLELHFVANPEPQAQFALLTDWGDSPDATHTDDTPLLDAAVQVMAGLNARHAVAPDAPPRFIVLHRERVHSDTQQCYLGWERKRGKLEQLIRVLAAPDSPSPFLDLGPISRMQSGIRYIVTLDSDTELPPGRLRELVAVAAHPHNQPRVDPRTRTVVSGYGILQPHVAAPLPSRHEITPFHWLFAGQGGIDPYSSASSEVYHDLFHEGSFSGKGLLHVDAMHAVLNRRLPDECILSHDLFEGSLARCAAVTDVSVIEDAPFHADVAASRVHRWTRGDWQLLPFLLRPSLYPLRAINRWKMLDNLRRSLVAPAALAWLVLVLATGAIAPSLAIALIYLAFAGGPLMGAVAGLAPGREDVAIRHFYAGALTELLRALCGGLWHIGQLLRLAMSQIDAVSRAIWRMAFSRRNLLEWTTAAAAQSAASTDWRQTARTHAAAPVIALVLWLGLMLAHTPHPVWSAILCALWAASPAWTWWASRPRPMRAGASLPLKDRAMLEGIARDTWRLFERCVGPDEQHLPPDNLQLTPHTMVAHRTSPTNIGLYLLSAACARQFGWIGTQELIDRLQATLGTLATLARHRGHFLNWYDTQSAVALQPQYVSTVDSGNLSGALLAVAQACREFALHVDAGDAAQRAITASAARLQSLRASLAARPGGALDELLRAADPLATIRIDAGAFAARLDAAETELAGLLPEDTEVSSAQAHAAWCAADHLATLRSALLDATADADPAPELNRIAARCETLAWEPDYAFLYHRKRRLLHIGYRVVEQQLDSSLYDLLASESRLTSLLAIAKGDVPVSHWASLGRPYFAVGTNAALRSWSGSMFEYLMPTLLLHEPHGSVLAGANQAALDEQIAYGRKHGVPWGISESAYAGSDHTLAYQYAPQGVPRLALRRTPPTELVIAPYATALAAQIAPHRAAANFDALERAHARERYGYIEAIDYTPARQSGAAHCTPVETFMAHHQGMSIVAIANVLLDAAPRRWAMGTTALQAVGSLLHERAPREVSSLLAPPMSPPVDPAARRLPGMLREVVPGVNAISPTHLLSNGRYSVSLRANGAGWSRWGDRALTRSRDDLLRDAHGWFLHLRWDRRPHPVSLTQHPAPDATAHYQSSFQTDRVRFDASWPELESHVTVWVSPEDDVEFRRVELRNLGDRPLTLELMSAFEVVLAAQAADEAHPAFSNLFVRARWQAAQQALVFERKPRLPTEPGLQLAFFLARSDDTRVTSLRVQTQRLHWSGRNHAPNHPRAQFPNDVVGGDAELETGLDPVCAVCAQVQLEAHGTVKLVFALAASDRSETLAAVIDKYRHPAPIHRSSQMSATLTGIRLRELNLSVEGYAALQDLTTAIVATLARADVDVDADAPHITAAPCDRRALWRFGISGHRPIVLVSASESQGMSLLRTLGKGLQLWSWAGVACDLVVINAEPSSYLMALERDLASLREQLAGPGDAMAGAFHVLRAAELSALELETLHALARVHFNADGRPLTHHVAEWVAAHETALEERQTISVTALPMVHGPGTELRRSGGRFRGNGSEFHFDVSVFERPARPWVNVLANPSFGAQLSEAGGGYTWGLNSRLNQLTPWSNDAVADPPGEWFLLQDTRTRELWSVTPSSGGDANVTYHVTHGQGLSRIRHRRAELDVSVTWCVDPDSAVKQVRIRLINRGRRTARLRVIGLAEWIMGGGRADRATTSTTSFTQRLQPHVAQDPEGPGQRVVGLTCMQRDESGGFGRSTAFLAVIDEVSNLPDWSCDRRESFDARGRLTVPDLYGQRGGDGLDPCAALAARRTLAPGESRDCVFLLGHAGDPAQARQLAITAAGVPAQRRIESAVDHWNALLGATVVSTPDPLFDALVNRWLLYQTVACRLWAKAGFYQAGGAFGYRDQLQDAMALAWAAPQRLREQIVLNASRQFTQGDVQHWWHAPTGAGVRTHFSDDLLWLPLACAHYVRVSGDTSVLDAEVPFIEGADIPPGAEDAYYVPTLSAESASVFEHAARTIDRSLKVGTHGLPLMGTGDWNDGMNRVGAEGRGESVWLAWFLCSVVDEFAPLAEARGEARRARRWRKAAAGWRRALLGPAWDGGWFKRAFFDDGTPLGSHVNAECRIDLIAQAWAVISGAAPTAMSRIALDALESQLVDRDAGLLRLLAPPLQDAFPSAGYIQAYPRGVRENGGQYSHAGVWALIARAMHGDADAAYRYFTYLSPAHRATHETRAQAYEIEPYVMAGDIYGAEPYVGRGGWSWYTGSAGWMHRAAIEHLFGVRLRGASIAFEPCLPSHWEQAGITLHRGEHELRVLMCRPGAHDAIEVARNAGAVERRVGEAWALDAADAPSFVLLQLAAPAPASASAATPARVAVASATVGS